MTPDILTILSDFVMAAVFVYAWSQERHERQRRQDAFDTRLEAALKDLAKAAEDCRKGRRWPWGR
jgi:beta-lactamase superfamily II metal-dependent hydrolase